MRDKILAVVILLLVIGLTVANTLLLEKEISQITSDVESIEIDKSEAKDEAERVFDHYMEREHYISLTVSHDDLTRIEEEFCEMISRLKAGDNEEAKVAKDRLIHSLEHLRRLSGFNIDSII